MNDHDIVSEIAGALLIVALFFLVPVIGAAVTEWRQRRRADSELIVPHAYRDLRSARDQLAFERKGRT